MVLVNAEISRQKTLYLITLARTYSIKLRCIIIPVKYTVRYNILETADVSHGPISSAHGGIGIQHPG